MAAKVSDLRNLLIDSIERVRARRMDPAEAQSIARLAGQINTNLQVEINARRENLVMQKGTRLAEGPALIGQS